MSLKGEPTQPLRDGPESVTEIIKALHERLDQLPPWPPEMQRQHPTLDRLQCTQTIDARLLTRALKALDGTPAASNDGVREIASHLRQWPNNTCFEVSGFTLQGMIQALAELKGVTHG